MKFRSAGSGHISQVKMYDLGYETLKATFNPFGFVLVSGMYRLEFKCAGILKGVVQNIWVKGLANVWLG